MNIFSRIIKQWKSEGGRAHVNLHSGMKKELKAIAAAAVVTVIISGILLFCAKGTVNVYYGGLPAGTGAEDIHITVSDKDVASPGNIKVTNGKAVITLEGGRKGVCEVTIEIPGRSYRTEISCSVPGIMKNSSTGNFTGWEILTAAASLFSLACAVILLAGFIRSLKKDLFSYSTVMKLILEMAFMLFGAAGTVLMIIFAVNPQSYDFRNIMHFISLAMIFAAILSLPFVIIFAAALCISNIKLIRKEGFRPVNLLGIILSGIIVAVAAAGAVMMRVINNYVGSSYFLSFFNVYCGLYMLFVWAVFSIFVIFFIISRRVPAYDKDCIVILGCAIRPDGTLYPLIRGRVDRALEFAASQEKATGKKAVFIPSGGQGDDEIISEGEAMAAYLREQGVSPERILPETKSTNTIENMCFSREIAEKYKKNASVLFSTTNYHVFRSGILSRKAGWNVDGTGSSTKWYFWPNALIREFIGLVVDDIRGITVFAAAVAAVSLLISFIPN